MNRETAVIRECFPTSVLLGSIERPVEPQATCSPQSVESDTIKACICTTDLCSGIGDDDNGPRTALATFDSTVTAAPPNIDQEVDQLFDDVSNESGRVRCHQCGSLFSTDGNPACERFERNDPSQAGECAAGEACLWYSWERSRGRTSFVRECSSPSLFLVQPKGHIRNSNICSDLSLPLHFKLLQ